MSFEDHLIHTCTIQRATRTQGPTNEVIEDWADHLTGVRCRLMIESQRVAQPGQGLPVLSDLTLVVPAGTDVTKQDRISQVFYEDGTLAGSFHIRELLPRRGKVVRFKALRLEQVN